jgi:diacylglycerol O-acyltransferase / wax synthase
MSAARLSALDASFLEVESPTAHMHVGWVATFAPPPGRRPPGFEEVRAHLEGRLCRAPRYRQRLAPVPLGVTEPLWVDDEDFDCSRHVRPAHTVDLGELADSVMSVPLARDRPLWEMWVATGLPDGRIGLVGKAHHCLVDGLAAVELASLVLDPTPEPQPGEPDSWHPQPAPGVVERLAIGLRDRIGAQLELLAAPARIVRSPGRLLSAAGEARRAGAALADSVRPATPIGPLNQPTSPLRHLALLERPLDDLRRVKSHFQTTVNDVVLAACAGGIRRFLDRRGQPTVPLKTMVPVSLRPDGSDGELGNQISFIFVDLPCDEPDPVMRLYDVHRATSDRKRAGEPQGADRVLKALSFVPGPVQRVASRMVTSERTFNLTISNIPGPAQPLYMLGCRLESAYPVVPLADRHALSIGMHTSGGGAFFGLYADRKALPDSDRLADDIAESIDELVELAA